MSKNRKIICQYDKKELDDKVELKVITKIPSKWLLVDLETGQTYIGTNNKEIGKQWKIIKK
jgi:hypothetical protein